MRCVITILDVVQLGKPINSAVAQSLTEEGPLGLKGAILVIKRAVLRLKGAVPWLKGSYTVHPTAVSVKIREPSGS